MPSFLDILIFCYFGKGFFCQMLHTFLVQCNAKSGVFLWYFFLLSPPFFLGNGVCARRPLLITPPPLLFFPPPTLNLRDPDNLRAGFSSLPPPPLASPPRERRWRRLIRSQPNRVGPLVVGVKKRRREGGGCREEKLGLSLAVGWLGQEGEGREKWSLTLFSGSSSLNFPRVFLYKSWRF